MNFNKFMHPRNIYRNKYNFIELAKEYPDLQKHLVHFDSGHATLDYKCPEALQCLTKTLLKKDFSLDVILPLDRLIPAVPQRLNYILWVEDLVSQLDIEKTTVYGVDIGTGASCIFPLIACRNNANWRFIATEVDEGSFEYAASNVKSNQLEHKISGMLVMLLSARTYTNIAFSLYSR